MKRIGAVILIVVLFAGLFLLCFCGESAVYERGYSAGWEAACAEGYEEGYREAKDEWFDKGYLSGYSDGQESGAEDGFDKGYDAAYDYFLETAEEYASGGFDVDMYVFLKRDSYAPSKELLDEYGEAFLRILFKLGKDADKYEGEQ